MYLVPVWESRWIASYRSQPITTFPTSCAKFPQKLSIHAPSPHMRFFPGWDDNVNERAIINQIIRRSTVFLPTFPLYFNLTPIGRWRFLYHRTRTIHFSENRSRCAHIFSQLEPEIRTFEPQTSHISPLGRMFETIRPFPPPNSEYFRTVNMGAPIFDFYLKSRRNFPHMNANRGDI